MGAIALTANEWFALTEALSNVGKQIPMFSMATNPRTSVQLYIIDREDWVIATMQISLFNLR